MIKVWYKLVFIFCSITQNEIAESLINSVRILIVSFNKNKYDLFSVPIYGSNAETCVIHLFNYISIVYPGVIKYYQWQVNSLSYSQRMNEMRGRKSIVNGHDNFKLYKL